MKNSIYKHIELTGTSATSIEDAVEGAIRRAHKSVRQLSWFEITEARGQIEKGRVRQWQVTVKVGFALDR